MIIRTTAIGKILPHALYFAQFYVFSFRHPSDEPNPNGLSALPPTIVTPLGASHQGHFHVPGGRKHRMGSKMVPAHSPNKVRYPCRKGPPLATSNGGTAG